MNDLQQLYQEVIFDHNRSPRNFRRPAGANRKAEGFNPLCGDKLTLYLTLDDRGVITDAAFEGSGCAISVASASLMTEALIGKTEREARALFEGFHGLLTSREPGHETDAADFGKLGVLTGVKEFPTRVKCATLAWHTLHAALDEPGKTVSTE